MRITPKDIDAAIRESRFDVHDRRLTVCVLTLQNGFLVTGESSCNNPADFDLAKGRAFALEQAREKVGALLAYTERERQVTRPLDVQEAVTRLSREFVNDPGFAWSWHCNIAMAFQDAAIGSFMAHDAPRLSYTANDAAARFMKQAFGVQGYAPGSMGSRKPEVSDEWGRVHTAESLKRAALNKIKVDAGTETPLERARRVERQEERTATTLAAIRRDEEQAKNSATPPELRQAVCINTSGCNRLGGCQGVCAAR